MCILSFAINIAILIPFFHTGISDTSCIWKAIRAVWSDLASQSTKQKFQLSITINSNSSRDFTCVFYGKEYN